MVLGEELEALFLAHLRRLQPTEETLAEFPRIAEEVWDRLQGDADLAAKGSAADLMSNVVQRPHYCEQS